MATAVGCGTGGPSTVPASVAPTQAPASLAVTTPPASPTADPGADSEVTLRTLAAAADTQPKLVIGASLASNDVYSTHAATYESDGLTIAARLLEPASPGPHPGVVLVHGFVDPGTYAAGSELQREQDALARAGYVVLYTELRGVGGSDAGPSGPFDLDMGSVEDVINAVLALRSSRPPDALTGVGLLGHSLGGLLVIDALVAKPGLVDAVVAFAPSSTDSFENVERFLAPGTPIYDAIVAEHGTPVSNPTYWQDLSPRTFADLKTKPLLIVHGDADEDCPHSWSEATVAAWEQAHAPIELVTLAGENHVFEGGWQKAMDAVTAFYEANLQ